MGGGFCMEHVLLKENNFVTQKEQIHQFGLLILQEAWEYLPLHLGKSPPVVCILGCGETSTDLSGSEGVSLLLITTDEQLICLIRRGELI